jgi:predicted transposase YdaD
MLNDIIFKKENDIFYIEGQRSGLREGENKGFKAGQQEGHKSGRDEGFKAGQQEKNLEFVPTLLHAGRFSISEVANFASVDEAFVKKVRAKLSQKN